MFKTEVAQAMDGRVAPTGISSAQIRSAAFINGQDYLCY